MLRAAKQGSQGALKKDAGCSSPIWEQLKKGAGGQKKSLNGQGPYCHCVKLENVCPWCLSVLHTMAIKLKDIHMCLTHLTKQVGNIL